MEPQTEIPKYVYNDLWAKGYPPARLNSMAAEFGEEAVMELWETCCCDPDEPYEYRGRAEVLA